MGMTGAERTRQYRARRAPDSDDGRTHYLPPYLWPPVAACCGGALSWSAERDWWRIAHAPGCRDGWQPSPPGHAHATTRRQCAVCGVYLPAVLGWKYCGDACRAVAQRTPLVMDHDGTPSARTG